MDTQKTVSFSGYRPEKLPDGGADNSDSIITLKADLFDAVSEAVSCGFDTFLAGMAEGFDMLAAETVVKAKENNPHIKLIAVLPFEDTRERSERYNNIIAVADEVVALADEYSRSTYYVRNEYMVDNSSRLICYYDGRYGGTEYTGTTRKRKAKKL